MENCRFINELSKNGDKILNTLMAKDIDESLENEIFEYVLYCLKNSKGEGDDSFYKFYESIFLHKFEGPFYLLKKEEFLNEEIENHINDSDFNKLKRIFTLKYRLLRLEGYDKEEIAKLLSKYHSKINLNDIE